MRFVSSKWAGKKRVSGFFIGCTLFLLSCSASKLGWTPEPVTSGDAKSRVPMNETFDPLTLDDDDIIVLPRETSDTPVRDDRPVTPTPESEETIHDMGDLSAMVQGFRVQLLATGDEAQAREARRNAIFRFTVDVYLVFEA